MQSKLETLIRQIQDGDIPDSCELPLILAFTTPDNTIVPGTAVDSTNIVVNMN